MNTLSYAAAATKQVTTHACQVHRVMGTFVGDTAGFIQIHDSQLAPAANAVPLHSIPVAIGSTTPQAWNFAEFIGAMLVCKNGLFIGVSSAAMGYTALAKNTDFQIDLQDVEQPVGIAGDLTSGRNSLQAISESTGGGNIYRLYRVDAIPGNSNVVVGLMVFAQDNPPNGSIPIETLFANADGSALDPDTTFVGSFGMGSQSGKLLSSINPTTLAIRRGITLCWSTTLKTLTLDTNADSKIRVEYLTA